MDIKKQYFDLAKKGIENAYEVNKEDMKKIASCLRDVMENEGVVQLFGVKHGEEVVNELFFRAGGLVPFHGLKPMELAVQGKFGRKLIDSGEIFETTKYVDDLLSLFKMDDRDAWLITSFYGNEPMAVELAKRAKEKGQKIIGLVNKTSYAKSPVKHESGKKLLDYCDYSLDMCAEEPDVALHVDGHAVGQLSSVYANVIAQMLAADIYHAFEEIGVEAPVLLSANIAGADKHNNALTDRYNGRVR